MKEKLIVRSLFFGLKINEIKTIVLLLFLLFYSFDTTSQVVKLTVTKSDGANIQVETGTGFILDLNQFEVSIVTCYHVIKNAQSIQIKFDGLPTISGNNFPVSIKYIKPDLDLALIIVRPPNEISNKTYNLEFNFPTHQNLYINGYPHDNNDNRVVEARTTRNNFVKSHSIKGSGGVNIFSRKISSVDLIEIDATVLHGMSGGILYSSDQVYGFVFSSLANGRSLGWVIPSKYVSELLSEEEKNWEIDGSKRYNWSEFKLINKKYVSKSEVIISNADIDLINKINSNAYKLTEDLLKLYGDFRNMNTHFSILSGELDETIKLMQHLVENNSNNQDSLNYIKSKFFKVSKKIPQTKEFINPLKDDLTNLTYASFNNTAYLKQFEIRLEESLKINKLDKKLYSKLSKAKTLIESNDLSSDFTHYKELQKVALDGYDFYLSKYYEHGSFDIGVNLDELDLLSAFKHLLPVLIDYQKLFVNPLKVSSDYFNVINLPEKIGAYNEGIIMFSQLSNYYYFGNSK